jgi:hypothetical protein
LEGRFQVPHEFGCSRSNSHAAGDRPNFRTPMTLQDQLGDTIDVPEISATSA